MRTSGKEVRILSNPELLLLYLLYHNLIPTHLKKNNPKRVYVILQEGVRSACGMAHCSVVELHFPHGHSAVTWATRPARYHWVTANRRTYSNRGSSKPLP